MMKITALLLCGSLAIFTTQVFFVSLDKINFLTIESDCECCFSQAFSVVSQTEAEDGATNDMEYIQVLHLFYDRGFI